MFYSLLEFHFSIILSLFYYYQSESLILVNKQNTKTKSIFFFIIVRLDFCFVDRYLFTCPAHLHIFSNFDNFRFQFSIYITILMAFFFYFILEYEIYVMLLGESCLFYSYKKIYIMHVCVCFFFLYDTLTFGNNSIIHIKKQGFLVLFCF